MYLTMLETLVELTRIEVAIQEAEIDRHALIWAAVDAGASQADICRATGLSRPKVVELMRQEGS